MFRQSTDFSSRCLARSKFSLRRGVDWIPERAFSPFVPSETCPAPIAFSILASSNWVTVLIDSFFCELVAVETEDHLCAEVPQPGVREPGMWNLGFSAALRISLSIISVVDRRSTTFSLNCYFVRRLRGEETRQLLISCQIYRKNSLKIQQTIDRSCVDGQRRINMFFVIRIVLYRELYYIFREIKSSKLLYVFISVENHSERISKLSSCLISELTPKLPTIKA